MTHTDTEMVVLTYLDLRVIGGPARREPMTRREALKARADLRANGYAAWLDNSGAPLPVDTFMRLNERHGVN